MSQHTPQHKLPIMESFYSLQGEGAYAGTPAYFIRLGGCDVGCHWCDVKESWNATDHPEVAISSLSDNFRKSGSPISVVTGGEPLMYDLNELTSELQSIGRVHLETSGVYELTGKWDWICFSPKKFKKPKLDFYQKAHELKVIVYNKSDFEWAEGHAEKCEHAELFLQPEWSKEKEMLPLIVEYVKQNPKWRISLQTHKYLNIP